MSSQRTRPKTRKAAAPATAMMPRPSVFDIVTQPRMVMAKIRMVIHSLPRMGPCIETCVRSRLMARDMSVTSGLNV